MGFKLRLLIVTERSKATRQTSMILKSWIATGCALAMTVLGFIRVYLCSSVADFDFRFDLKLQQRHYSPSFQSGIPGIQG